MGETITFRPDPPELADILDERRAQCADPKQQSRSWHINRALASYLGLLNDEPTVTVEPLHAPPAPPTGCPTNHKNTKFLGFATRCEDCGRLIR